MRDPFIKCFEEILKTYFSCMIEEYNCQNIDGAGNNECIKTLKKHLLFK